MNLKRVFVVVAFAALALAVAMAEAQSRGAQPKLIKTPLTSVRAGNRVQSCTRKGGASHFVPDHFVLLRAASGPLDELQAAASGMPVGKQEVS